MKDMKNVEKSLSLFFAVLLLSQVFSCGKSPEPEAERPKPETATLTFFQLNLWEGMQNVGNGLQSLIDQLVALKPDVASFCEFPSRGTETSPGPHAEYVLRQAAEALYKRTGIRYYKTSMTGSGTRGVLTRHPVVEDATAVPSGKGGTQPWFYRTVINFNGQEIAVYSSHSTPYYYACYLPRGYGDGSSPYGWDKLKDGPVTDVSYLLEREKLGDRMQMAVDLDKDAHGQAAIGRLCLFGGDLNQPSCLDWTKATGDLYQHRGCVVPWTVSDYLLSHGFKDAYREVYPDPVKHPGMTWPVYNKDARKKTEWAAEADERDRIDYVYFRTDERISILKAQLVGPDAMMAESRKVEEVFLDKEAEIILPARNLWCSDHRGLFMTFSVRLPL